MKTAAQVHEHLQSDVAYAWSVERQDPFNMQLVLRGYGFEFTLEHAFALIEYATQNGEQS